MDCLPKDVIAIIQRYVFDYNYRALMSNYCNIWLGWEVFYWERDDNCFRRIRDKEYIANHRMLVNSWFYRGIFNFYTQRITGNIPEQYNRRNE